ncbi:MAG: tRNA pseudouridine(38-40) synthase TruA [Clostridia bacterium]|jgi:tRNA pseudouridine38-40 synthase|nr:tRNA pseudouridine(38-40) synthase TruA [Clostridia bacterium]MDD3232001.1 tRNA pseudouridine(38-40) synthase TruA [Clostridia bacterium]MDD3862231.1 tRNA pseudouridine(38-40) synthase TruA [Clostridia bacterium]MDD4408918.1 tRNA pseudouridine(38-40) synthase TruA [Clostridia bacterium]
MVSKIKLTIQYNGEKFCGWQSQQGQRSVQQTLENKISALLNENIKLITSGRTDAGVHAIMQVAHFETASNFDLKKLPFAINDRLDNDVRILKAEKTKPDFHARFSAKQRIYLYRIYCSKIEKPLKNGFAVQIPIPLNIKKMKEAAHLFVGTHDFSAFHSANSSAKSPIRTIYDLKITKSNDEIHFKVTGNGFLYKMVRIIVGTLIEIGEGKLPIQDIPKIFESKNRANAGKTMLPFGLYLCKVKF